MEVEKYLENLIKEGNLEKYLEIVELLKLKVDKKRLEKYVTEN